MKKFLAILICVITVLTSFAGCSDKPEYKPSDPNAPVIKTENYSLNKLEVEYFRMLCYRRVYEQYIDIDLDGELLHQIALSSATKEKVRASLEKMLRLCEEAKARGIGIGDEEKKYAESVVMDHIVKAGAEDKHIEDIYGKKVTQENMLKVLELEALAKKVETLRYKELESEILNDSAKIDAYTKANGNLFYKGTFLHASVDREDTVEKLKGITDKDEFIKAYVEAYVKENLLSKFNRAANSVSGWVEIGGGAGGIITSDFEPVDSMPEVIENAVVLMLIGCIEAREAKGFVDLNEARLLNAYNEVKGEGDELDENMKIGLVTTGKVMLTDIYSTLMNAPKDSAEFFEWLFSGADVGKTYASESDVYLVIKTPTVDNERVKSMAQIFVKIDYKSVSGSGSEEDKNSVIAENVKTRNEAKEKFDAICDKVGKSVPVSGFKVLAEKYSEDSNVVYENVPRGQMLEDIDTWLYSPRRTEGDMHVIETKMGFHLLYYIGDGDVSNKNYLALYGNGDVDGLLDSAYGEWLKGLSSAVTVDEKTFNEITDKAIEH